MTARFMVYDLYTGEIKRIGNCVRETLGMQAIAPEDMVMEISPDDEISDATHYIDSKTGRPTLKPPPPQPTAIEVRSETIRGLLSLRISKITRDLAIADLVKTGDITPQEASILSAE